MLKKANIEQSNIQINNNYDNHNNVASLDVLPNTSLDILQTNFDNSTVHSNTQSTAQNKKDLISNQVNYSCDKCDSESIGSYNELPNCSNKIYNASSGIHYNFGYLKLIVGCMFSGKTTQIIRECNKWRSIGKKVLMINYELDKRYSERDLIVTHDKLCVDCLMLGNLDDSQLNDTIQKYDVIIINEAQFFTNLRVPVHYWCNELKKVVIVSGLDGNYMRNRFGEISELLSECDDIEKLKAYCSICKNGTNAIFTWKITDNYVGDFDNLIDICTDKYIPLCREHYNIESKKIL